MKVSWNMSAELKSGIGLTVWGLAGVLVTLGVVSLGTVAWLSAGALLLASVVARIPVRIPAVLVGAALPLLLIAFGNAFGPGWSCHSGPNDSGCDQLLDPRPFLLAALALLAVPVGLWAVSRGHRNR